ncbi:MAG: hypothetical protein R3C56_30820 [Pirellulaceae bacterium]
MVGYTDGLIGYLTDAAAYRNGEYEALTVPKILDILRSRPPPPLN